MADEVESEMDLDQALAAFDVTFEAAEGTSSDADPDTGLEGGSELDVVFGFEGLEDGLELFLEFILDGDVEQIGDVIALEDFGSGVAGESEEDVTREERFFEDHGFAAVFFDAAVEGQGGFEGGAATVFGELFFAARAGMGDEPDHFEDGRIEAFPGIHEVGIGMRVEGRTWRQAGHDRTGRVPGGGRRVQVCERGGDEIWDGARWRVRTSDPLSVSEVLYH